MTREGKPDYQYQPRCHVNGILPTTPWLFSYENTLKRVKMLSSYFDLFWYRLSTTTTYWHKQTKTLNTCTTLINAHCTLLTANQKWHDIMLIQPINRKRFHFDAPNASESSKVRERQKLKQLHPRRDAIETWTGRPPMFLLNSQDGGLCGFVDLDSGTYRFEVLFPVLENGKPWNKWSECDWGETELEELE